MSDVNETLHRIESRFNRILAAVLCVVACATLIIGLYIPPSGEIHTSVLVAFGEIMTFAAGLLGINAVYKSMLKELIRDGKIQNISPGSAK